MGVSLRPLNDADLDQLYRWECDDAAIAMAAFTRPDPADRAAFDEHYRRVRADPTVADLAVEHDGHVVGMIAGFTVEGDREVTYWIDPARWGRGIASEALRLFLAREPIRPLHARAAQHNLGSARVLTRNGFAKVGEESSWAPGLGRTITEDVYRLE